MGLRFCFGCLGVRQMWLQGFKGWRSKESCGSDYWWFLEVSKACDKNVADDWVYVLVLYALNLSRQSSAVLISVKIHVRWKHVRDTDIRKAEEATWGVRKPCWNRRNSRRVKRNGLTNSRRNHKGKIRKQERWLFRGSHHYWGLCHWITCKPVLSLWEVLNW